MKKTNLIIALIFTFILISTLSVSLSAKAQTLSYEVQRGDTLWELSRDFGVPVQLIIKQNNISNSRNIYVGQELVITTGNNQIIIEIREKDSENNNNLYTVKSGDTLWIISQKFNVSLQDIVSLNNLGNDYTIYIGQKLKIPGNDNNDNDNGNGNNNYTYYTIQPGDILWNIAQKYDTTVQKLVELNNIKNAYDLYVGKKILVPARNTGTDPADPVEEDGNYPYNPHFFYQIKEGDRVWTIADKFGIRVSTLINYNNLEDINNLKEGDILIVPLNKSNKLSYLKRASAHLNNYYRVQNGETLAQIADYYQVPEAGLRAINQLTASEEVYPGQRLLMPVSPALFNRHELYTVRSGGEYLFNIAYEKGISIKSILKANYLRNPNQKFAAGKVIIVPLDENSKTTWIDFEDGEPVNSWFNN